jgi:hypothetical protein
MKPVNIARRTHVTFLLVVLHIKGYALLLSFDSLQHFQMTVTLPRYEASYLEVACQYR